MLLHIEHPAALANELNMILRKMESDERFRQILLDDPFPLMEAETADKGMELVLKMVEWLRATDSITIAITMAEDNPEYLAYIRTPDDDIKLDELADGAGRVATGFLFLPESDSAIDFESDNEMPAGGSALPPFDLTRFLESWCHKLSSVKSMDLGEFIVFSNSGDLIKWAETAITLIGSGKERRFRTLQYDRRFLRATSALNHGKNPDVFAYFIPARVFPLWDTELTDEKLRKFGYEELVGAAVGINFAPSNPVGSAPLLSLKMAVPFTVPPKGIVQLWNSYQPIESIPPLALFLENGHVIPYELNITSQDRNAAFEIREQIYRENGESDQLAETLDEESKYAGSVENLRDYFDGNQLYLNLKDTEYEWRMYNLTFQKIGSHSTTMDYLQQYYSRWNEESGKRIQRMEINGLDGWFSSEEDALANANEDFEVPVKLSDRHLISNRGYVVGDKWLIHGDLSIVRQYLETSSGDDVDAGTELERFFPGARLALQNAQPSRLEMSFANRRLSSELGALRVVWLQTRMERMKAMNMVYSRKDALPFDQCLPVTSPSDRVFAVADWIAYHLLRRYNRDLRMFTPKEQAFEWTWQFFGSPENE